MRRFTIDESDVQKRLDIFVAENLPEISRAYVRKLYEKGSVEVNDEPAKLSYKLKAGDRISIDYESSSIEHVPDIELPILYEDGECVVINKPTGLLTHSKGSFNPEATVATWLNQRLGTVKELNKVSREGIVHRLDRGTSGVMILAKTPEAMSWLQKQFSTRKVKKTYIAIVVGELNPTEAVIDMPIERNPRRPQTFRVGSHGKPSKTHYKVLKVVNYHGSVISLVELKPETGRTHQLRVHLKQQGHPIIGDSFYDGRLADRLYLHARDLELTLPNKERRVFSAKLPKEFDNYLENLK